jgi:hypothetical protein
LPNPSVATNQTAPAASILLTELETVKMPALTFTRSFPSTGSVRACNLAHCLASARSRADYTDPKTNRGAAVHRQSNE